MSNPRVVLPTLFKRTSGGGVQVWNMTIEPKGRDCGMLVTEYGLQDGKKQVIREVISEGKNTGRKNATTGYEQAVAEGQSRWQKQLTRKGYGETVEASAATRAISPMLAHPYDKKGGKVDWTNAYAQPKFDGFRLLATLAPDGVTLRSREGKPMPALAHIAACLRAYLPKGGEPVILDGEAYCHGMKLNAISSACKKAGELTPEICYHVYDMIADTDFTSRHESIHGLFGNSQLGTIKSVKTVKVRSESELMRCQGEFVEDGYEGAMLRFGSLGYQAGKRSNTLLKVKTFVDEPFEVVDYKMGRGKYEKTPIFTCITKDGHHFDVTAPGSMEEKEAFGHNPKLYLHKTLTVKFQYYSSTAEPVPVFPVAKCFEDIEHPEVATYVV